ncbi:MAG TPA: hypothetical protein VF071_08700 [Candidatus Limnocylindria bacterium]
MGILSLVLATALVLAGCGSGGGGSALPSAEPAESEPASADFELEVMPAQFVGMSIGGQPVVFLVTVSGTEADGAVEISATAEGAAITVEPQPLTPGVVGEVTVVPASVDAEGQLAVTLTASRGGVEKTEERTLMVMPGDDTLANEAARHLAPFIAWLEANRPELGITQQTDWDGSLGGWVLIVEHYQYLSKDWELGLSWHVMVEPDDWARIYLRHRWTETEPSLAFEISSFAGASEPIEITPEGIWR